MVVTYELPEPLNPDLEAACRERCCTVREFIGQLVHAELATRRLPNVKVGTHGAFTSGWRGDGHHEEEAEPDGCPVEHRILIPSDTLEML